MQLELSEVNASLINFNARAEIHGEEKEPAGDLKIKAQLSNDCLAMFHPTLKAMLYHYNKTADADLVDEAMQHEEGYAPHLRFAEIPSLAWKGEMVGVKCIIHTGINEKSSIVLDPCNVNNILLEPQQGGTVCVTFRVQSHPDEQQFGKLCGMIGTDIVVSLELPKSEVGAA